MTVDKADDASAPLPINRPLTTAASTSMSASPASASSHRRFAPEVVEMSTRSHKASRSLDPLDRQYRTDVVASRNRPSPSNLNPSTKFIPSRERRTARSYSNDHKRQHSFQTPALETVVSAGSELNENTHRRQSQAVLEYQAKHRQKRMHEQALAAFPNSDIHEHVDHYVNKEDSIEDITEDRPTTWDGHDDDTSLPSTNGRAETLAVNFELEELKEHHESLQQERNVMRTTAKPAAHLLSRPVSPWWQYDQSQSDSDSVTAALRNHRSPPMLGADLVIPRSASPQPERIELTQPSNIRRAVTSDNLDALHQHLISPEGLWGGVQHTEESKRASGLWESATATRADTHVSIEMTPADDTDPPTTDDPEREALRRAKSAPNTTRTSLDISQSNHSPDIIEDIDDMIDHEYSDSFVSQVFNYLSLGYPSLARAFDAELSQVTHISISDLRQDDLLAQSMPKGYIRLGTNTLSRGYDLPDESDDDIRESRVFEMSAPASAVPSAAVSTSPSISPAADGSQYVRWRALRLYIRDWARTRNGQSSAEMLEGAEHVGTAPRRGSWAW